MSVQAAPPLIASAPDFHPAVWSPAQVTLPADLFSRTYTLEDGKRLSLLYRTRSQLFAQLEGDSAEVWERLFNARGDTSDAVTYMRTHGQFDPGQPNAPLDTLSDFVASLTDAGILGKSSPALRSTSTMREIASPQANADQAVGQIMADQHIFYSLVVELTYRCNEACLHCYCPGERRCHELSLADLDKLLTEFQALGGFQLQLTGGEIFSRADIDAILAMVTGRNLVVSLTTNLTLATEAQLQAIAKLNPRSVGCSIYSADPVLHDRITQIPGSHAKSVRALKRLRELGVPAVVKTPLMADTLPGWRAVEELAESLDCNVQFDLAITAKNDGGQAPTDLRATDEAQIRDLFSSRFYSLYVKDEPISEMMGPSLEALLCGAGATGLTLSPDGTVRPCIGLTNPMGVWPKTSLEEIWTGSPFFADWTSRKLKDVKECAGCDKFAFCIRCPGAWQAEHGDAMKPSAYTCVLAGALKSCSNR